MRSAHTIIIINKTNWKTEVETFDKWPLVLNMRFHWHRILFSLHLTTSASRIFIRIYKKCVLSAVVLILCSHFEHAEANRTQKEKKINKFRFLEILELIKITSLFSWTVFVFFIFVVSVVVHWCFHTFFFGSSARAVFSYSHWANQQRKKAFDLCSLPRFCRCSWDFALSVSIFVHRFLFHYFYFHSSIVSLIQHFTRHTYSHTC